MRYYPCRELNLNDVKNKLKGMYVKEYTEICLLTLHGIYKYIGDELTIFKFNLHDNNNMLRQYVDNTDFLVSSNTWKKIESRNHLPMIHRKTTIKNLIFSPNAKSKFKFIIESSDTGKIDYYFTSPEEPENKSLKEDISSFLQALT